MKLVRFGAPNEERVGLLHDGTVRDLSDQVDATGENLLDPDRLRALGTLDPLSLPLVEKPGRIGACVGTGGKIVCVGLNYRDHAAEAGLPSPDEPILFMKGCRLTGPQDSIRLPTDADRVDWEIELAIVIGRYAHLIDEDRVNDYIAGYAAFVDISERDWQMNRGGQWVKGKSWPGFAPIGPWLVTPDEIPDPSQLRLHLAVNGKVMQHGTTRDMIFAPHFLVSYISRFMPLYPGDVIATGTPAGVGMGKVPPVYIHAGNRVCAGIDGLGMLEFDCLG